jgi:hypothetical protein
MSNGLTKEYLEAQIKRLEAADLSGIHPESQGAAQAEIQQDIALYRLALLGLEHAASQAENERLRGALERVRDFGHAEWCESRAPVYECGCYQESQAQIAGKALSAATKEGA